MVRPAFHLERDPANLAALLPQVVSIADAERNALGFLAERAFHEAVRQRRLVAMIGGENNGSNLAGYLLFGGVFPNARIYQIGVRPEFRRRGVASGLVNALISDLERLGYMTLSARVALDLDVAQHFYEKHGFSINREVTGGRARDRRIVVRVRELETDTLFTLGALRADELDLALGLKQRGAGEAPFYVIDLNVLFDLVRKRNRSPHARRLFGAALAHRIRLVVAPEFIVELQRTTLGVNSDPILQMALQLPRLPSIDTAELNALSDQIYHLVFVADGAHTPQALSDARHLAHAALARASGYITSDGTVLAARRRLMESLGIDVASLDELMDLLPEEITTDSYSLARGQGFDCQIVTENEVSEYLQEVNAPLDVISEFHVERFQSTSAHRLAVRDEASIVAIGVLIPARAIDKPVRLLVHARPHIMDSETFADHLLDTMVRNACVRGPAVIELRHIPGQSVVTTLAKSRGFLRGGSNTSLLKVALGRPLTAANWHSLSPTLRRKTGIKLPDHPAGTGLGGGIVSIKGPNGEILNVTWGGLEELLSPTIVAWQGRTGVLQPIAKGYADELLGTSNQLSLLEARDAAFLSRRAYVNTARAASRMQPDRPIFFYESQRTGGRGAVIAAGRIVDTLIVKKEEISADQSRRLVVQDVEGFSRSDDVLVTSFDNLLVFPKPCPLARLRSLGAVDSQNLQSTTSITDEQVRNILDYGWSYD